MTLVEFLLERIGEDEDLARVSTPGQWKRDSGWSIVAPSPEDWHGPYVVVETKQRNDAEFVEAHSPARVLAECESKRRIVNEPGFREITHARSLSIFGARVLGYLALPYSSHPDYNTDWATS